MRDHETSLPAWWAEKTERERYEDAGPTLEAIDRLMDGLLIPPPMKELIQILMARGILQLEAAEKAAGGLLKLLRQDEWKEAADAQQRRLR